MNTDNSWMRDEWIMSPIIYKTSTDHRTGSVVFWCLFYNAQKQHRLAALGESYKPHMCPFKRALTLGQTFSKSVRISSGKVKGLSSWMHVHLIKDYKWKPGKLRRHIKRGKENPPKLSINACCGRYHLYPCMGKWVSCNFCSLCVMSVTSQIYP